MTYAIILYDDIIYTIIILHMILFIKTNVQMRELRFNYFPRVNLLRLHYFIYRITVIFWVRLTSQKNNREEQ